MTDDEIEEAETRAEERVWCVVRAVLVLLIALGLIAAWFLHRANTHSS